PLETLSPKTGLCIQDIDLQLRNEKHRAKETHECLGKTSRFLTSFLRRVAPILAFCLRTHSGTRAGEDRWRRRGHVPRRFPEAGAAYLHGHELPWLLSE